MPSENLPSYKKANLQMVAYRRIQSAVSSLLSRFHLNTTQWIMLGLMSEASNGLRVTDMARALQVEMPLITTTAQTLISAGLMSSVAHARDKRAKMLTLTPKGKERVSEIETYLKNGLDKIEQDVDPRDLKVYFKMLQKIASNASSVSRSPA
ncbi:MAG: MarR family transcriptional regulator [Candidatus Saccharimonadales bacterium]